jgi:hypothetical protein
MRTATKAAWLEFKKAALWHPTIGDGYKAAVTNFGFLANAWSHELVFE